VTAADDSVVSTNDQTATPAQSGPAVLYEARDSGVAVVTFNRPERMNAWGNPMGAEFYRCVEVAEADPAVRVIVITGKGRAFCAGADMGGMQTLSTDTVRSGEQTDFSALVAEKHPYFLTQLTKPVIAAINGAIAGIGLSQALMADIRFAAAGSPSTGSPGFSRAWSAGARPSSYCFRGGPFSPRRPPNWAWSPRWSQVSS
jgi:1,4-dihydroxy-2-naphthoyl-CoA synthase